jgi:hypothetical protein
LIHIVQCLCPQRHTISAVLYDPAEPRENSATDLLRESVEGAIKSGLLNPWCGICSSRDFTYEDRATRFETMEEALRVAKEMEKEQLRMAAYFKAARS